MKFILRYISILFCSYYGQKLLNWNILISQYLTGVGAGSGVWSSGEKSVVQMLKTDLSDTGKVCVLDVGANIGQFLNMLSHELPAYTADIHAFEPVRHTFETLQSNEPENQNIILNNLALAENERSGEIYYDTEGSGLASLTKRDITHIGKDFDKSEKVRINTLDKYCSEHNIEKINLLKLDVEGHELDVLKGARNMLKKNRIHIITFEFGGCNIDTKTSFRDFFNFFNKVNSMNLFRITPCGYFFKIEGYSEFYEQYQTTNYLVINDRYSS